ncbi:MAG: histidine--tRNA ligase [Bacilli bacterium]|jgi:histidyl-tRNA synthetase|nr:histidine--tRNA ligase [Bacilli bacterium]MDD3121622.1 histidine--tRNA ligase [Bacilli bacterium]MDD4062981.1 histidine--tRNA ligase [Bacilli bacterium]MDD4482339.1 histidine--tRNA ligase [Bacilli bacterium]
MSQQKLKGTIDYYNDKSKKLRYIQNITSEIVSKFGFEEIILPIIENTNVFSRSSGEESDIVTKEMYTFLDRGNRSITLRPEGTAGVVRSYLENKLYVEPGIKKLYYFGPMFRYERPQAGRYRQFYQFGIEAFGEGSYLLDADIILTAYEIFKMLKINNIKVLINSIGDFNSRNNYAKVLQEYFKDNITDLCADCKRRYNTNPLRILDCKIDKNNPIIKSAPKINEYLTVESKLYFENLIKTLEINNIPFEVDTNLVRGLDYYTDTVFEFIIENSDSLEGLALGGGGKYASLVKSMGGPDIPGVGYAFGIERIISIMEENNSFPSFNASIDCVILSLDEISKIESMKIASELRKNNISVDYDYTSLNMKPQFKLADRLSAKYVLIYGEKERNNKSIVVKNQKNTHQEIVKLENLIAYLKQGE